MKPLTYKVRASKLTKKLAAPSMLTKELAAPSMLGVRSAWYQSIGGLTPSRLAQILSSADQGDILDYLTLAEEMEERDLHYHSVLSTRKNAVTGLTLSVVATSDEPQDVEIADFVRGVVEDDAFSPLLTGLIDALGKGFSVCEILWDRSNVRWTPLEYKHRDARFFQFDLATAQEIRLRDEQDLTNGLALEPYKFVTFKPQLKTGIPIRGGLARLAVIAYMCKSYTLKDWLAFAEVFGMPLRVGKHGAGATPDQKAALLSAVASIGTDTACIIPDSMVIEFVEAAKVAGGDKLFEGLANWLDHQVSKGVLGQTMTTDDGSSLAQANVHDRVRGDIRDSDAVQLASALRRGLVTPLVDLNFGPLPRGKYPKLALVIEQPEDLERLSRSLAPFIDRGLRVEASVIRDKFNLPEPEDGAEVLAPQQSAAPTTIADVGGLPPSVAQRLVQGVVTLASSTVIQTLIVSKDQFKTQAAAAAWVAEHGFHVTKVDETSSSWRFRQRDPGEFEPGSLRTVELTDGVKSVMGKLKTATARAAATPDEIDRLTDTAVEHWAEVMDPLLQPVLDLARDSSTYDQFLSGLEAALAQMDSTALAIRLATATFKARGLGDARDRA